MSASLDLPAGWTATPLTTTPVGSLAPGATETMSWTVTVPDNVATGTDAVAAEVTYQQGSGSQTTGGAYQVSVVPKGLTYISDLPFVSETNGFGALMRDANLSGGPLSIDGVTFAKGLGTNAISSVVVDIPSGCTTFSSYVGVDDTAGTKGTVTFSVLADGVQVASTGVMRGGQPAQYLTANVSGAHQLTLDVGDAGDGIGHDNGDWGDAELDVRQLNTAASRKQPTQARVPDIGFERGGEYGPGDTASLAAPPCAPAGPRSSPRPARTASRPRRGTRVPTSTRGRRGRAASRSRPACRR